MARQPFALFAGNPEEWELYCALEEEMLAAFSQLDILPQKTQIRMSSRHPFAFVSLPSRRGGIVVSFALAYEVQNCRVFSAAHPTPGRWTHHVMVFERSQIDGELMDWLSQAYAFARKK
ncbi:MAG: DUF5655 domain-containing protein [Eubacteriales bacterium]|nr:DUF5655 domain-containing protein [Eubacteriales bacterium]